MDSKLSDLKALLSESDAYWQEQHGVLRLYTEAYENRFWSRHKEWAGLTSRDFTIQTPHAHKFIEQYVSALFIKEPAVVVGPDATSTNAPAPIGALVNRWLAPKRTPFEDATRLALLYPSSFIKLYVQSSPSIEENIKSNKSIKLDMVQMTALNPWDVLVDRDAGTWDAQRYVGHRYYLPLPAARELYSQDFVPKEKVSYLDNNRKDGKTSTGNRPMSDAFRYVEIIEHWDFQSDCFTIWTPDTRGGAAILEQTEIPIRDALDRPMCQIIPLYFCWEPDAPLVGVSTMSRAYDLLAELNVSLTHRANAVHRNNRKYLVDKSIIGDAEMADLLSAADSVYIPVDLKNKTEIASAVHQVSSAVFNQDFDKHVLDLEAKLETVTALPAFMRGQDTQATATEVGYLNSYAANEVGKMSRQKDEAIERASELLIRFYYKLMEDTDTIPIEVENESLALKRDNLAGAFTYRAADGGASPISLAQRKQEFLGQVETLAALGASKSALLEQIVKLYSWDKSLLAPAPQAAEPMPSQPLQATNSETTPAPIEAPIA